MTRKNLFFTWLMIAIFTVCSPIALSTDDIKQDSEEIGHSKYIPGTPSIYINGISFEKSISVGMVFPIRNTNISSETAVAIEENGQISTNSPLTIEKPFVSYELTSHASKLLDFNLNNEFLGNIKGGRINTTINEGSILFALQDRLGEEEVRCGSQSLLIDEFVSDHIANNGGGVMIGGLAINLKANSKISGSGVFHSRGRISLQSKSCEFTDSFFTTPTGIFMTPLEGVESLIQKVTIFPREFIYSNSTGYHQSRTCLVNGIIDYANNIINLEVESGYIQLSLSPSAFPEEKLNTIPLCFPCIDDKKMVASELSDDWFYQQGVAFRKNQLYADASKFFDTVLSSPNKDLVIKSLHNLGTISHHNKQYLEAKDFFERANSVSISHTGQGFQQSINNLQTMQKEGLI